MLKDVKQKCDEETKTVSISVIDNCFVVSYFQFSADKI